MKINKILIYSFVGIALCICAFMVSSRGPAAENREQMHYRAKIFQDSIATIIRAQLSEAETPGPVQPVVIDTSAKKPVSAPAPGAPGK